MPLQTKTSKIRDYSCLWTFIISMRAQEFDAFALRSYSFAVRKTNSYFSITTLLLSAAIITVSLLINVNSISHLWLSLEELPRFSSNSLSFPNPLTSTLVCYKSTTVNNSQLVPKIRVLDSSKKEINFRSLSSEEIQKQQPTLYKKLGSNFGCLNIQGINFSKTNKTFYFQVDSPSASLFVQSITQKEILSKQESLWIQLNATTKLAYKRLIRVLYASIQDSLMANSEPVKRQMIYYDKDAEKILEAAGMAENLGNYSTFMLQPFLPGYQYATQWMNYNRIELTVTRLDFGSILGGVLSWASILGLLCSFLVGPAMEKALQLLQTEALFLLPARLRAPSLLRFLLAPLGLFRKEGAFLALQARLEQLKDVAKTLKILKTLRRLTPGTAKTQEAEIMASEQHFGNQQSSDPGIQIFQQSKQKSHCFEQSQNQPKKSLLSRCRKTLFHLLDAGSDTISVTYSKNGHGSTQSLCLSLIFLLGFLFFLSFFGVFDFLTSATIYQTKSESQLTYTLNYNEIIIATNEQAEIIALLLDGDYTTVSTVSLTNKNCIVNLTAQQVESMSQYAYTYCFQSEITLNRSNKPNEVASLYIGNQNFFFFPIVIFHFSPPSPTLDYSPFDNTIQTIYYSEGINVYIQQNIKLTSIAYQGQVDSVFAQFTLAKQQNNCFNQLAGINIVLSGTQTFIDYTNNTFFDIIQNIWGFAIICFTILLMKLTKYINLRQKEKSMTVDRMEFRDSLCILLSKIQGLATGRHREELRNMRYYVKGPLLP